MATITINGVDYDTDKLSKETLQHLQMVQLADEQIQRLRGELTIAQTARGVFAKVLMASLPVVSATEASSNDEPPAKRKATKAKTV